MSRSVEIEGLCTGRISGPRKCKNKRKVPKISSQERVADDCAILNPLRSGLVKHPYSRGQWALIIHGMRLDYIPSFSEGSFSLFRVPLTMTFG